MERTQVVIIGGGATGAGILWDLSLRGIPAVLLEKKDLANGATGRCHGLLHSGGRYVVKDAEAAKECISENMILKRVAAPCVHDTGGMFVHVRGDDPQYVQQWADGCNQIGIATQELSRDEALALEPNLPADIVKAYTCPDGHIDVFQLTLANIEAAVAKGAIFRAYSEVTGIEVENHRVRGVRFRDVNTGEEESLECEIVINAAGGWAQQVAAMAAVEVPVRCDRGALLIFNHCVVKRVVNRCRKPGDADILVPCGPVCILGTSSVTVPGPEGLTVPPGEVQKLLGLGVELIPALAEARLLRIFTGARPLYVPKSVAGAGGREVSRNFALLDHKSSDGIDGFMSIVGGKLTTYRLMAKATADLVCQKLHIDQPCVTDQVPLRDSAGFEVLTEARKLMPAAAVENAHRRLGSRLALGGEGDPTESGVSGNRLRMRISDAVGTRTCAGRLVACSGANHWRYRQTHATRVWSVPRYVLWLQSDAGWISESEMDRGSSQSAPGDLSRRSLEGAGVGPGWQAGRTAQPEP